ncbi:MAG: hypothetical protein HY243_10200 [Proteobacteria bacterium]|nr:hypothetical protein [Pseudomonadota bacterium]
MLPIMFRPLFARQIVAFVLALGVTLSGAAPSWAMPGAPGKGTMPAGMSMTMSGTAMQKDCMASMERGTPNKGMPRKGSDNSCAVCTVCCALPVAAIQNSAPFRLFDGNDRTALPPDVSRNGVAVLPALPPPILRV